MATPHKLIRTERLLLLAADQRLADAVLDYQLINRRHLAPWDPPRDAAFFSHAHQRELLRSSLAAFDAGSGYAYWLCLADAVAPRIVGQMHFSNVQRGALHSAMLGYSLAAQAQGQGLMQEALRAGIAEMFGARVALHRIQANVRPENSRSRALLERLGFQREGLARQYLFIDGAWRNHLMTALINRRFDAAAASSIAMGAASG